MKLSSYISQVGCSWLDRASKVTSGSVISNNVGALLFDGISATILFSACSSGLLVVMADNGAILGDVSISTSLEDAYLVIAIWRVWTIFQDSQDEVFKFLNYLVLKYDPSPTTLQCWILILCYRLCVLMSIKTQGII